MQLSGIDLSSQSHLCTFIILTYLFGTELRRVLLTPKLLKMQCHPSEAATSSQVWSVTSIGVSQCQAHSDLLQ